MTLRVRTLRTSFALVAAFLSVGTLLPARTEDPGERAERLAAEADRLMTEVMRVRAERLGEESDELGPRLLAVLDRETPPGELSAAQFEAARGLAALRYPPAVPSLVRHIGMTTYDELRMPIAELLPRYGDAAVPELVRAYLREGITFTDPAAGRQSAILITIREGKTAATARTYALGLAAEGDAATRERVDWFLEELASWEEHRPPRHKLPVPNTVGKP
jgi:hypothetical protein